MPRTSGFPTTTTLRGPNYAATSASSLAVANSGSKTFVTQAGLAYTVGSRVRAASSAAPATNWMEGVVTSYSGTSLVATMDVAGGSGTYTDWSLSLAGARGATGATGSTGSTGATGPGWEPTPSAFVADPTGGAITDAEARTAINSILDILIAQGLMAAS